MALEDANLILQPNGNDPVEGLSRDNVKRSNQGNKAEMEEEHREHCLQLIVKSLERWSRESELVC